MNKTSLFGAAMALGLGALCGRALLDPPARAQEGSPWLGSFEAARSAARQSGKPIFLVFR